MPTTCSAAGDARLGADALRLLLNAGVVVVGF
jgi:hypothetical protein